MSMTLRNRWYPRSLHNYIIEIIVTLEKYPWEVLSFYTIALKVLWSDLGKWPYWNSKTFETNILSERISFSSFIKLKVVVFGLQIRTEFSKIPLRLRTERNAVVFGTRSSLENAKLERLKLVWRLVWQVSHVSLK